MFMQNLILFKLTNVEIYQTKYVMFTFTEIRSPVSKLYEKIWFSTHFLCKFEHLRAITHIWKNENVAETTFDLQFDIVMVHNSFHPI